MIIACKVQIIFIHNCGRLWDIQQLLFSIMVAMMIFVIFNKKSMEILIIF